MIGIEFAAPERLWLLLAVAAIILAYVGTLRWRHTAQMRFTEVELLDEVAPDRPQWRRHLVAALMVFGLVLAVLAAARPIERESEAVRLEGRIVLAFDVSLSMMATDVEPDRFRAAQQAAREFIAEVDGEVEIALVSFSGTVTVEVPLTTERFAVERGIDALELAEATAIGDALAISTRLLENAAATEEDVIVDDPSMVDEPPGVIVLLTDGETTVGRPTIEGARLAAEANVPVYAIAFGTEQGTVPDPGGSGQVIPVPVRPDQLRSVAELTGGADFSAQTAGALAEVYDEIRENLVETLGEDREIIVERSDRWALAAFLVVFAGWGLSLWWLRGLV